MVYYELLKDFGFIVLCPNLNERNLISTVRLAYLYYLNKPVLVVCSENDFSKINYPNKVACPKNNYLSYLNIGLKKSNKDYNFILNCGDSVASNFEKIYHRFLTNENEILFRATSVSYYFHESNLTGLLIRKKHLEIVGDFEEDTGPELSKIIFQERAKSKNIIIKGILPVKIKS